MSLPTDATERKNIPIYSGFICYFPDAMAEVAKLSKQGNDQHNPGQPLHWDRDKSGDELDALTRHLVGTACAESIDEDIEDARAVAWRSMANLQKLCERREQEEDADYRAMATSFKVFCTREEADAYVRSLNEDWGEPQCES